jgi:hypothetical protein
VPDQSDRPILRTFKIKWGSLDGAGITLEFIAHFAALLFGGDNQTLIKVDSPLVKIHYSAQLWCVF